MLRMSALPGIFEDNSEPMLTKSPPDSRLPSSDNQVRAKINSGGQFVILNIAIRAKGSNDKII